MSAGFLAACEHVLSAATNGVYQGILVTVLAGLIMRGLTRTNAATRHAVWFGVLLLVTALIPAHLLLSRPHSEIPAATPAPGLKLTGVAFPPSVSEELAGAPLAFAALPSLEPEATDASGIDLQPPASAPESPDPWARGVIVSKTLPVGGTTRPTWPRFVQSILKPLSQNLETAIQIPHWLCLGLVSAWALLAGVRGWLLAGQLRQVRRVKKNSSAPGVELQMLFNRLRDSLTARRPAQLRISSTHQTAVVLGFVHPAVLLPVEMSEEASGDELEQVLRHELAHVARWDDWGNLAQQAIQAALFFHPAVWWISRRLSLEREIACDDQVLEASRRPRDYALTLANVACRMNQGRDLLAPGVSNNHSQLQQRITMILNTHRDRSPRLARSLLGVFTTATAILAVLAIDAGPRLVLAQSPPPEAPAVAEAPQPTPPAPPAALLADNAPAPFAPDSGVESGARIKSDSSADSSDGISTRISVALPAPAITAAPDNPLNATPPRPPIAVLVGSKKDLSVEERLDRIERILEDLEAHKGDKLRRRDAFQFDDGKELFDGKSMDFRKDLAFQRAAEEGKRAAQDAQRAAETAQRAMEESRRSVEKVMRDMESAGNKDAQRLQLKLQEQMRLHDGKVDGSATELQALRSARDSLGREMQNLERQIKHLEEDQKRQANQNGSRNKSDDSDDGKNGDKPEKE
jgi:beta-lactamase regulating signal transducer with metallopeptidase domain